MIQIPERDISNAVVNVLRQLRAIGRLSYFVNLEGAKRDARQQVAAKRHGMRPGRPDIEIILPEGKILFIELKRLKGGKLTPAQEETRIELSKLGHDYRIIKAADANSAVEALYLILGEYGILS